MSESPEELPFWDELPEALKEHARRFAASGATPVVPRRASTVVLLRPPLDVYLMQRASTMAFAANMYAFPGGAVEERDLVTETWSSDWAPRLGLPEEEARAIVRAAVREVFEETGVTLEPHQLAPWAHWVTPEFEPRRYDTYFFVARLPDGQEPRAIGREAAHTVWMPPAEAVRLPMLPPTKYTLRQLCEYPDLNAVLAEAAGRTIGPQ